MHPGGVLVAAHLGSIGRGRRRRIAWINSVGNLAGYLSPFLVGRIRDAAGSMTLAYLALGASGMLASGLILAVTRRKNDETPVSAAQAAAKFK